MGILILFLFDYNPPQGKRSGILGGLKAQWSAQPRKKYSQTGIE